MTLIAFHQPFRAIWARSLLIFILVGAPWHSQAAANWEAWPFEQSVDVSSGGLKEVILSPETFDAARADLADLRILDPDGNEAPFFISRQDPSTIEHRHISHPAVTLERSSTRLSLQTKPGLRLRSIRLDTSESSFLKAISIDAEKSDGTRQPLVSKRAIYRQNGAENLQFEFKDSATDVRRLWISIDDSRTSPIPITEVRIDEESNPLPQTQEWTAKIVDQTEGLTDNRVVVDLSQSKVPLVALRLGVEDPLFIRQVRVLSREWSAGEFKDRLLTSGTIHRIALEGTATDEQLEFRCPIVPPNQEITLSFINGNSPPLKVRSVLAIYERVRLVFLPQKTGTYRVLSGNPYAVQPQYDLAPLASALKQATRQNASLGKRSSRNAYRPSVGIAEAPILGGVFDPQGWRFRREVQVPNPGVQRLELPLHALAQTRSDHSDLRIVQGDRQVLYLLNNAGYSKFVDVPWTRIDSKEHPQNGRWRIDLPQAGLPITSLRCEVKSTLLDRELRVTESAKDQNGQEAELLLGRAHWTRTPENDRSRFDITIDRTPSGNVIWLDTDNGNNAPLELQSIQIRVPGLQLIFQTTNSSPLSLFYGNEKAGPPNYDLQLIAPRFIGASKSEANIADADPLPQTPKSPPVSKTGILYASLGLVVVGLTLVLSKLIPKESSPGKMSS